MKINDAIWGFVLMALGAAVLWAVRAYPNIPGQPVGPALFPGLIAMGLCAGGALLVWQGWRDRAHGPWLEFRSLQVAWGRSVFWAVVATVVVHFAFYKLLRVPLPWGILTPIAW